MTRVVAYDIFHNEHSWVVEGRAKARETATRIVTEGLWYFDAEDNCEVFLPPHQVVKVKVYPLVAGAELQVRKD